MGKRTYFSMDVIALLGTMSDRMLAQRLGVKRGIVTYARTLRRIPAFQVRRFWSDDEVALLGTMTDAEVAKRVGRSKSSVQTARFTREIKEYANDRIAYKCWDEVERDFTTSHIRICELSARYGIPAGRIEKKARAKGWMRPPKLQNGKR